ncbi:sensor domain-containing diguanylate cyclase [Vibrio genomosp. F10]|uniref:sensor domain-containing diguanylate cyclase n=1 Tax=Vibrio genomosp. F10 TaxID=723171 RepID=UPI001F52A279|nr:diguanylate cyclase [Vibrio genomosp. F10]
MFVAGPLELVQGGMALVARYPIFTDIPQNNEYWGGLSVVIDYDKLIAQSALSTLKGATIALTGHNNQLIEGDEKVLANYDASYPIYMPNGNWNLFAKYTGFEQIDSIQRFNVLFRALGWATFSVIYILVLFLIRNYIRVQKLSLHDELTKLLNRRFLFHELNKVMSRNDNTVHFTILNMDLDKFKDINDSLGHEAGDAVLKYIASLLTHSLRSTDFVSRVSGDEFIVILQRLTIPNDVQKVIEKIKINVKQNAFQW